MPRCLTCGGNLLYDPLDECLVCMLCSRVVWLTPKQANVELLPLVDVKRLPMH